MRPLGRTLIAIAILRACLGALALIWLSYDLPWAGAVCLIALGLAQFSDHLDGWLARHHSTPSVAGYLQDSISDKLFHAGCLIGLSIRFEAVGLLFWGLLAREFILLACRVLTPDLEQSLNRYRPYSVLYAAAVRLGILAFLICMASGRFAVILIPTGYSLLCIGVSFGLASTVVAIRSSSTAARPPK
jgi:phosphatidylglycerophosphate synthase